MLCLEGFTVMANGVEVLSKCVWCRAPTSTYLGKFKCSGMLNTGMECAVPVILCAACAAVADGNKTDPGEAGDPAGCRKHVLTCELCREGHQAPVEQEQTEVLKRRRDGGYMDLNEPLAKRLGAETRRVFIRRLPFVISAAELRAAVLEALLARSHQYEQQEQVELVHWLADNHSGLFYGSVMLQMRSAEAAADLIGESGELMVGAKKAQAKLAPLKTDEVWPPAGYAESEMPKLS